MTALMVGAGLIAAAVLLFAGLVVTYRPSPDPYDQPHRDVEPWPTP